MSETKAVGVRARVRAELTAEIKQAATRQLATEGAAGLSLRAIARELGMASSAIYRYFASREELLTALIIDAYNASAQAVEDAEAACDRSDHGARFVSIGRALREWAVSNPNEWALIYGSPVPGYAAPTDTIDPATRVPTTLLTVLIDSWVGASAGAKKPSSKSKAGSKVSSKKEAALGDALADLMAFTEGVVEPSSIALGVEAWAELVGLINLELFGHFKNAITDTAAFFEHALETMAARILPE